MKPWFCKRGSCGRDLQVMLSACLFGPADPPASHRLDSATRTRRTAGLRLRRRRVQRPSSWHPGRPDCQTHSSLSDLVALHACRAPGRPRRPSRRSAGHALAKFLKRVGCAGLPRTQWLQLDGPPRRAGPAVHGMHAAAMQKMVCIHDCMLLLHGP